MKKSVRSIVLMALVGIIAVLVVYSNGGSGEGSELVVTSVTHNGSDVTEQMDLQEVAEVIGGASITKNKHENTGDAQWVINFDLDGTMWTMELGVSEDDIDTTYSADARYKVKNGSEIIEKLEKAMQ